MKVILTNRDELLNNKICNLHNAEIESFLFDGYRFMNRMAIIQDIKPDIQENSPVKLCLFESLDEHFKTSLQEYIRIEDGYTIIDNAEEFLKERKREHEKMRVSKKNVSIEETYDGGVSTIADDLLHDLIVCSAATKGVKVRYNNDKQNKNKQVEEKVFYGYLNSVLVQRELDKSGFILSDSSIPLSIFLSFLSTGFCPF